MKIQDEDSRLSFKMTIQDEDIQDEDIQDDDSR